MANSRIRIDPTTNLPSIHSFGDLSNFLRSAVADEESRQFSESMGQLAVRVEAIIAAFRITRERDRIAPQLVDLLTVLRGHRNLVVNLGMTWRGLYEYAVYLQSLNNFRVLIGQWLLDGGPRSRDLPICAEDFELVAWRTLGEGMLLIDMYDQWLLSGEPVESKLDAPTEPMLDRAVQWWKPGR
ncbi:hypothetical protein GCM10027034_25430 [Ramlibacter solisilvae]|uniref:Uncharacterized protein n=1 Tax=Ramlibacter tataouinensis TaxID=94132 RepID=A0A127JQB9_9BURK|nr:hypothetical protein [Ramlibacter tataouinensis]AMO22228.1 hypothetical protein UC35_04140 [Ramlibacter tataouinensis]